jgi:hypothetical protein
LSPRLPGSRPNFDSIEAWSWFLGIDLIRKLLRRLLGLVVVALTLQELDNLILADVHARFPSRK